MFLILRHLPRLVTCRRAFRHSYLSAKITISRGLLPYLIFFNSKKLLYLRFANASLMRFIASLMLSSLVA